MDQNLKCDRVRDLIDEPSTASENESRDLKSHLESCPSCRSYERVSASLAEESRHTGSVDLWTRFRARMQEEPTRPRFSYQVAGLVALAAVAVVLAAGLLLNRIGTNTVAQTNVVASNSVVGTPVNTYDLESSDLDYYYEISMKF